MSNVVQFAEYATLAETPQVAEMRRILEDMKDVTAPFMGLDTPYPASVQRLLGSLIRDWRAQTASLSAIVGDSVVNNHRDLQSLYAHYEAIVAGRYRYTKQDPMPEKSGRTDPWVRHVGDIAKDILDTHPEGR